MQNEKCFYVPGSVTAVDTARLHNGSYVSFYAGETLAQLEAQYPGVKLMETDEAVDLAYAAMAEKYVRAPVEISEERFNHMLDVLPPVAWRRGNNCESFKVSELLCGEYAMIFARVGFKFFELSDNINTPHETIIQKCRALVQA